MALRPRKPKQQGTQEILIDLRPSNSISRDIPSMTFHRRQNLTSYPARPHYPLWAYALAAKGGCDF
jgi:hypothetical protein